MRHAYLVIAHSNWKQLQKLVSLLDDERNDIYIHIDKKSDISDLHLSVRYSEIHFVDRVDIRWGHVSLIKAEMELFGEASKREYSYYHLLSGFDMPLHCQDYIHGFFERHSGMEFIGFGSKSWKIKNRVYCHNFFMPYMRHKIKLVRYALKTIRIGLNKLQLLLNINIQKNNNMDFRYGCQWVSVTHDFVVELLKKRSCILSTYQYAYCPDEIYKQTFAINSRFRNRIFDVEDEFRGCMRELDWKRGHPYIWQTEEDFEYLSSSDKLFARKFDYDNHPEIVDKLIEKIHDEKS